MSLKIDCLHWRPNVIEWIKQERTAATIIAAAVAVLMLASVVSGCQVSDYVKVKVPSAIQEAVGVDQTVTMTQAGVTYEDWIAYVTRNSRQFSDEIERGAETVAVIDSLTETGINVLGDATATLPGGALISTGLALMGGLFLRRPGDAKRERKEKEASFRAGLAEGQELLTEALANGFGTSSKSGE